VFVNSCWICSFLTQLAQSELSDNIEEAHRVQQDTNGPYLYNDLRAKTMFQDETSVSDEDLMRAQLMRLLFKCVTDYVQGRQYCNIGDVVGTIGWALQTPDMLIGRQNDSSEGQGKFLEWLRFSRIKCLKHTTKDTCTGCDTTSTKSTTLCKMNLEMLHQEDDYVFEDLVNDFFKTSIITGRYCESGKCIHDRAAEKGDSVLIQGIVDDTKKYNNRFGKILEVKATDNGSECVVKLDTPGTLEYACYCETCGWGVKVGQEECIRCKTHPSNVTLPVARLLPLKRMDIHRREHFEGLKPDDFVNITFKRFLWTFDKNNTPVTNIPITFNMSFDGGKTIATLVLSGATVHKGVSMTSGHYIDYSFDKKGQMRCYNDQALDGRPKDITHEAQKGELEASYMLLYKIKHVVTNVKPFAKGVRVRTHDLPISEMQKKCSKKAKKRRQRRRRNRCKNPFCNDPEDLYDCPACQAKKLVDAESASNNSVSYSGLQEVGKS